MAAHRSAVENAPAMGAPIAVSAQVQVLVLVRMPQ